MRDDEWRAEAKRAQSASAAAGRRQRYRPRARGLQAVQGAGMVRVARRNADVPAPGGTAQERNTVKIITITPEGDLDLSGLSDEILRTDLMLRSKPIDSSGTLAAGALVYAVPAVNTGVTAELGNIWAGKARVIIYGLHPEHDLGH